MTLSQFLPAHDANTVALDYGVFIAEQARTHRVSQNAIIAALRPCITAGFSTTLLPSIAGREEPETAETSTTPPQPEDVSSKVPAAQTDGEVVPPPSASPSVAPIPETSGAGAHGGRNDAEPSAAVAGVPLTTDGQANTGGEDEALTPPSALDTGKSGEDQRSSPAPGTKRAAILAFIDINPGLPARVIAQRVGSTEDLVRATASKFKRKLTSWWDYERALKAQTTEALKGAPAKPQEAVEPPQAPEAAPRPEQPPANKPAASLPLPAPVIKVMRQAFTGRFYIRDRATLLYVHQSLAPNAEGTGPLMTGDRKRAWYDTMDRFRGAQRKWPQIASLRKEAANA